MPHIPAIVARLENEARGVRRLAVRVLGDLGEHAVPHIPAIEARLEHWSEYVRHAAAEVLALLHAANH